jgi:hypothetical protein
MDSMLVEVQAYFAVEPAVTTNEILVEEMARVIKEANICEKYDFMSIDMYLAQAVLIMQEEKFSKILSEAESKASESFGFGKIQVVIPEYQKALHDSAWHRLSSSFWLRNSKRFTVGNNIVDIMSNMMAQIEEWKSAEQAVKDGSAFKRCEDLMKQMRDKFPELGLSFGYIGNCDLFGNKWDDRSWKFFTKICDQKAYRISFGNSSTQDAGRLANEAEKLFEAWCQDAADKLKNGEYRKINLVEVTI